MSQIQLRLFGAFRNTGETQICVDADPMMTIKAFKEHVRQQITDANLKNLVMESAIADDEEILELEQTIGLRTQLAILPPVCGG